MTCGPLQSVDARARASAASAAAPGGVVAVNVTNRVLDRERHRIARRLPSHTEKRPDVAQHGGVAAVVDHRVQLA
jgi:hypothetical protein